MLSFVNHFLDVIYIPPEQFTETQTAAPIIDDVITNTTSLNEMINTAVVIIISLFFAAAVISAAVFAVKTAKSRRAVKIEV